MDNQNDILLPPHDTEAEKSLVGSLILMPAAIDEITSMVCASDFYGYPNRRIFEAITSLYAQNVQAIDIVTIGDELQKRRALEEIGGAAYLFEIMESVPHASHVRYYAAIVKENSQRRSLIHAARDVLKKAYDKSNDVHEIIADTSSEMDMLSGRSIGESRPLSVVVEAYREALKNPLPPQSTGLKDLDDKLKPFQAPTGGFRPTQLIVLAARPGMGKTSFAMDLINAASDSRVPSLMVQLEMVGEDLAERIDRADKKRLEELSKRGNIYIEDRKMEIEEIISAIRNDHKRRGVRFVVVDYLGLIEVDAVRNENEKLDKIARRLKLLAKSLRIPIVLAGQLNRKVEDRDNKRPQLADIRGSGAIEQHADTVMFLYRHEVYFQGEKEGHAEIIVAKQRNGPTGIVEVGYLKEQTRFVPKHMIPVDVGGFFEDKQAPF